MADELVPGTGLTWTGSANVDPPVSPGERGVFIDYDGREPEADYVVNFPGGRQFCCRPSDVTPDARLDRVIARRHKRV